MREAINAGKGCRTVILNYRKDGSPFWNEVTLTPIKDDAGRTTHYIGIQHDVSSRQNLSELELAYDVMNEQMVQIERETDELHEAKRVLFESNQRLHEFVALVAHDMQNPISAILSCVEVLSNPDSELSISDKLMYGAVVRETAERLLPLLSRLMDAGRLAKLENEPVHLARVNVSTLAELIATGYYPRANMKNITIEYDIQQDIFAFTDETAFYEIIDNLISNALKYTPSGKRIGVRVCENAENIIVEIWDEGLGLSENDKHKIFKTTGKLSARPTGGETSTGLGLMSVLRLSQRIQGRVWCESELGKGSQFFLEIMKQPK